MKKVISFICSSLFFVIGFELAFSINASAYIDPSVMTYAIQAIAGIAIAVGAGIGASAPAAGGNRYTQRRKADASGKSGASGSRQH